MSRHRPFICPHCHTPIDPVRMETARHGAQEYRICPECDEAIVWVAATPREASETRIAPSDHAAYSM